MDSAQKWDTIERYLEGYPYSPYRDIELGDLEDLVLSLRKGDIPETYRRLVEGVVA